MAEEKKCGSSAGPSRSASILGRPRLGHGEWRADGAAWCGDRCRVNAVGGDMMLIEATRMPGKGSGALPVSLATS